MSITSYKNFFINEGIPTVVTAGVTLLSAGSQGTAGALRKLTHPSVDIADLVYWGNPDQWTNMDSEVLTPPITSTVQTLSSRVVNRFEQTLVDMLVMETWSGGSGRASMPASFARKLYNYWLNEPDIGDYITWAPREISTRLYAVKIVSVIVGNNVRSMSFVEIRDRGGKYDGGDIMNALDEIDGAFIQTGVLSAQVTLTMKIVADIT